MKTKICPKGSGCGRTLPATLDYFYPDKTRKDKLSRSCRDCIKQKRQAYYAKHIKETATTSTHFPCVAMQAELSVLVCLKRQRDKGYHPITRGIPGGHRSMWVPFYQCIDGCKQGAKVKERIKALL